jgi:hypothetical protein
MKMDDGTWQRVRQPGGTTTQIITITNPVFTVCRVQGYPNYTFDTAPNGLWKNVRRKAGFSSLDWWVVPKYKKVRTSLSSLFSLNLSTSPLSVLPELFVTDPQFPDSGDANTSGGGNFSIGRPQGVPSSKSFGVSVFTPSGYFGNAYAPVEIRGQETKIIPAESAEISINPQQVVTKILPPGERGDVTPNSGQFIPEEFYANDPEFVLLWNEEAETAVPPHPCKPPKITLGTGWQIENPLP